MTKRLLMVLMRPWCNLKMNFDHDYGPSLSHSLATSGKKGLDLEKPRQLQASLETPRDSKDFKDSK